MSSGYPAASSDKLPASSRAEASPLERRRRRRHRPISRAQSVYDWTVLMLAGASPCAGIWLFGGVRLWSVGPLMLFVFAAGALFFLRPLIFRLDAPLRVPPAALALLGFGLYAVARIPGAAVRYDAYLVVLTLLAYVQAYWIWSGLAGEQQRWRWVLAGLLLAVTAMAWYAVIQEAHDSRMVLNLVRPESYGMRASGAYFCPNHFADLLGITMPFALALAVTRGAGIPLRLFAGYSVAVALPPLYLSQSRSGWLGALLGITVTVCLLGLRRGARRFLLRLVVTPLVVAAVAVAAWAVSPVIQQRVADALQGNVRLSLWRDTLSMIAAQPWWGFGPGSYRWVYPHFQRHMTLYLDPQFAHNDYLQLLVEFGVVGAVLLIGVLAYGLARLVACIRRADSDLGAPLVAGLAGSVAATAAHACFDYNFHIFGNVQVVVLLAGVTCALLLGDGSLAYRSLAGRRRIAAAAFVPLLLLLLTARAVASYGFALKGDFRREVMALDDAEAAYRRALRIEPRNWEPYRGLGHTLGIRAYWNRDPDSRNRQAAEGMEAYRKARARNPWDTESLYGMSRLYNALGEPDRALETLRELVDQVPFHRDYLVQLGLQLRQMGHYEEALRVFERARGIQDSEMIALNIQMLQQKLAAPTGGSGK